MGTEETSKKESASVRKVWVVNETPDSNPRLAENLSLLSDALHMELEPVQTEAWIGNYNGDILADDKKSDTAIVIEHRSDESYHYQLGQVLGCAENYNARILIWIADNFREEHRAALDWLNRWTPAEVEVYGVEIHSTHESDANANLKFVPVIAPVSWSKCSESRPIPKIQSVVLREFFQPLVDDLRNAGFTKREKAAAVRYHPFPTIESDITYYACFENDGTAWVYISGGKLNRILSVLREDEHILEIARELGISSASDTRIDWKTQYGSLGVYRGGSLSDEEKHDEMRQWMCHYLIEFNKVFNPRIRKIIAELQSADE